MPDQCPLCERRIETLREFCVLHQAALKNLEEAYATWSKGYGASFTKELYYTKLESLSETGQAVKDVIRLLRSKGER